MNRMAQSRGFLDAFRSEYALGPEDRAAARRRVREDAGQTEDAPRIVEMIQNHPLGMRVAEATNFGSEANKIARRDMGIGFEEPGNLRQTGQMLGAVAGDLTQDATRNFWWLLNAAQATGNVATELGLRAANKKLYETSPVLDGAGLPITMSRKEAARNAGIVDSSDRPKIGVRIKGSGKEAQYVKPNYSPGDKAALMIPTGLAINAGMGLLTPLGGAPGYKAIAPSEEDPSKTDNVVEEVAMKYFLGRTGGLLPYDDFVQQRPDVSKGEYGAYKGYKFDKETDLNPFDDGDVNLGGVIKATDDGIHGAEVEFLGKSLPVNTALMPFGTALAGTLRGVRTGRPIRDGLAGGLAGLAAGRVAGGLVEAERQRRNGEQNEQEIQF